MGTLAYLVRCFAVLLVISPWSTPTPPCASLPPFAPPRGGPRGPSSPRPYERPACAPPYHDGERPAEPGARVPDALRPLEARVSGRGRLRASVSVRAFGVPAAPRAMRRRHPAASSLSCPSAVAPASPPHGRPCSGRWRSLASSTAHRACRLGYDASPREQTHQPGWWGACPSAWPRAPA